MSDSENAEGDAQSSSKLTDTKSDSKKKLIRLLTVMAYVSSVSMAAVMLSMYYIFLWEPKVPEHHLRADPMEPMALQQGYPMQLHPLLGDPGDPGAMWLRPPPPLQSLSLVSEEGSRPSPSLLLQRILTLSSTSSTSVLPTHPPNTLSSSSETPATFPSSTSSMNSVVQWVSSSAATEEHPSSSSSTTAGV